MKTELLLYVAILSFLLGFGTLLNFPRDFSLFGASTWSYVWPLPLAALFFYVSIRLVLIFWGRRKK